MNLPIQPRRFSHTPNIVDDAFFTIHRRANSGVVLFVGGQRAIKGWPSIGCSLACSEGRNLPCTVDLRRLARRPAPPRRRSDRRRLNQLRGDISGQPTRGPDGRSLGPCDPSLFEVAPLILAEAWAMRLPVVAGAVGGIPDLASGAAALGPPSSASKLAERLIGVPRGYAGLDALAAEGCCRAESHSSRAVGAKHLSLYSELLREHG